jgi:hypothetical protein
MGNVLEPHPLPALIQKPQLWIGQKPPQRLGSPDGCFSRIDNARTISRKSPLDSEKTRI